MLILAVALLPALQHPVPAAEADGWRRFEGAGVSLEVPPGSLVEEHTDGAAYFLDLRRPDVAHDQELSLLRVVLASTDSVSSERMSALMSESLARVLHDQGFALRGTAPLREAIAGAEREGERRSFADERGSGWEFDGYSFTIGGFTAGLAAKTDSRNRDQDRALHARVLRSIALHAIDGSEPILARIGSVGVRLPSMYVVEVNWTGTPARGTVQLQLPEGVLTMSAQNCRDEGMARLAEEAAFEEFVQRARRDAAASRGALTLDGHAAGLISAGAEVFPFRRIAVQAQGKRHEILACVVRDGPWVFALQLAAAADRIAEAERRFVALLASLDFAHPRPQPRRIAGQGLRWSLPAWARATVYPAPQFILQLDVDHANGGDLPTLYFEWRDDFAAERHPEMHAVFRAELFPDQEPTWTGQWTASGPLGEAIFLVSVLGEQGESGLLATAARPWRDATLAVVLTLPHARNAAEAQQVLARWFAEAEEFPAQQSIRLRAGRGFLDLPDGEWLGWELEDQGKREVAVAAGWGEWHLRLEEHGEEEPWSADALSQRARAVLGEALELHHRDWNASEVSVGDECELAGLGRAARLRQDLSGAQGQAFLEAYVVSIPRGLACIWVFARGAADGAARADIDRLLRASGCEPLVE